MVFLSTDLHDLILLFMIHRNVFTLKQDLFFKILDKKYSYIYIYKI